MIIYNVTVNIDHNVHEDWLEWMKQVHIPDVMATGAFLENKISKVLADQDEGGITYAIQYISKDMETYERYQKEHAPRLQQEHSARYEGKFAAFRTLLEVVHSQ